MRNFRHLISTTTLISILTIGISSPARTNEQYDRAVKFYNEHRYKEALLSLEQAQRTNANDPNCEYYMALCYQQLGDMKRARLKYQRICAMFPNSQAAMLSASAIKALDQRTVLLDSRTATTTIDRSKLLPEKVRIPYQKDQGWLVVEAIIDGKAVDIPFDTGADLCSITRSRLSGQIDFSKFPLMRVKMPDGSELCPIVPMTVTVGDMTRKVDVLVIRHEGKTVIGQNFFAGYSCEVDERFIRLYKSHGQSNNNGVRVSNISSSKPNKFSVPYQVLGNCMLVDVMINEHPVKALFDTGCQGDAIVMTRQQSKELIGFWSSDNQIANKVEFGPISRLRVSVRIVTPGPDYPLVGPAFLQNRRFTIDPENKRINFAW